MATPSKFSPKQKWALWVFAILIAGFVGAGAFIWKDKTRSFYFTYRILKRTSPQKAASMAYEKSEEFRKSKDRERMLALYDEMIESGQVDATILNNRAFWLLGKDNERAERYLTHAIALSPACAECLNNMATIILKKEPEKAKELLESAAKARPNYVVPRLNLAVTMENRAEWKKALDWYRDALAHIQDGGLKEKVESRMAWMSDIVSEAGRRDISRTRK